MQWSVIMRLEQEEVARIAEAITERLGRQNFAAHSIGEPERLAYTEQEAAQQMGIAQHVLRDARLRGEIVARKLGKRWLYSREVLIDFLRRTQKLYVMTLGMSFETPADGVRSPRRKEAKMRVDFSVWQKKALDIFDASPVTIFADVTQNFLREVNPQGAQLNEQKTTQQLTTTPK